MSTVAKKHILLVEDDYFLGRLYTRVLKHAKYTVTLVDNGNDALRAMVGQRPDLVLLDVILPGMGGMEVLQKLKGDEASKSIPVILLTNLEQDELMEKAMNLGANGYWIKVVMLPQDLVKYVEEFFKTPQEFLDPKTILFPKSFYSQSDT